MTDPCSQNTPTPRRANRGQVMVMFALFSTAMLGVLGLAVDLGFAFAERRTMQNAADAGALAGAHAVAKATTALPGVTAVAQENRIGSALPSVTACAYVNDADATVGSCGSTPPATATGVKVSVQETHGTFFIRAVRTYSIMKRVSDAWVVDPAAVGKIYTIHGPQISKCSAQSSRFKGLADGSRNGAKGAPGWLNYDEGTVAGQVSSDVQGVEGCRAGQAVDNCIAFLPMAVNTPAEAGNNKELWAVAFLPFYITKPNSNEHDGKLMSSYIVYGRGAAGWDPGYGGPIVVRLTI